MFAKHWVNRRTPTGRVTLFGVLSLMTLPLCGLGLVLAVVTLILAARARDSVADDPHGRTFLLSGITMALCSLVAGAVIAMQIVWAVMQMP